MEESSTSFTSPATLSTPNSSTSSSAPFLNGMTTSTHTTTTIPSKTTLSANDTAKCEQCAHYLKEIFLRRGPESRPLQMLLAMGAITKPNSREMQIRPVPNGFAVAIRSATANPATALPSPSLVVPTSTPIFSNNNGLTVPSFERNTIQATSSMKTNTTTDAFESTNTWLEQLIISCRPCSQNGPERRARSFMGGPNPSEVVLCSNRLNLSSRHEVEEALVHEMVHAYDAHVQRLDFRSCLDLAYSEVRAAREAECAQSWMLPGHCVKTTATRATNNLFPEQGRDCVQQVFASAMADRKPLLVDTMTATTTTTTSTITPVAVSATATSATTGTTSSTTATSIRSHHSRSASSHQTRHSRAKNPPANIHEWNRSNQNSNKHALSRSFSIQQHSER